MTSVTLYVPDFKSKNRNPITQWFWTFPQTSVTKEQFKDSLAVFKPKYTHIVRESHSDGNFHLHAVCQFDGSYSKAHLIKTVKVLYPADYKRIDVAPIRSLRHAIAYLGKEDLNPLITGVMLDKIKEKTTSELDILTTWAVDMINIIEPRFHAWEYLLASVDVYSLSRLDLKKHKKLQSIFNKFSSHLYLWILQDDITFVEKNVPKYEDLLITHGGY